MSELYPCKESISYAEFLQVTGLLVLAKRHMASIDDIEKALRDIIGQAGEDSHCGDAIFSGYSAEELLDKMECKVRTAE
jgi:hypothetical protein